MIYLYKRMFLFVKILRGLGELGVSDLQELLMKDECSSAEGYWFFRRLMDMKMNSLPLNFPA